jgi:hypothetical protein
MESLKQKDVVPFFFFFGLPDLNFQAEEIEILFFFSFIVNGQTLLSWLIQR